MTFTHDTEINLQAAVTLVNTEGPPDSLTGVAELDTFYAEFGYTGTHRRTRAELDEVRALRPVLRGLLTSQRDDAAVLVNRLLAEAHALPQLVRHDEWDWHLHAVEPHQSLATQIAVETAMAMIDVIRADEMSRLATCAGEACFGVVLDLSRNRSRKFCSTACGNRAAVAAYRARQP